MGVKKYFKNEFEVSNFGLEHDSTPEFYLGCWQRNRSCVPLLFVRGILCVGNIAIVLASMIVLADVLGNHGYWWIYLTHWGLVANALTASFAFAISLRVYFGGPLDSAYGLPWYIKVYWFLYNAATPLAFMITIFYWSFLDGVVDADFDPVVDVFAHAINSVTMFVLLITSRHPSRVLHFYHPIAFGIAYLIFTLIYYYAGGTDSSGNAWIYPMMDWSKPGEASLVVVGVTIGLVVIHGLVVLIASCRNHFGMRYRKERSFSVSG